KEQNVYKASPYCPPLVFESILAVVIMTNNRV
ncbi:MAG: hypothetical protein ACI8Q3_002437, partial [Marinomonas primoryensis]